MDVETSCLLVAGIAAVVGAVVRRWRFLAVVFVLWVALQLSLALAGDFHSDEDTPTTLVVLSFLYFLGPAELGAGVGTAAGKLVRLARQQRHATP